MVLESGIRTESRAKDGTRKAAVAGGHYESQACRWNSEHGGGHVMRCTCAWMARKSCPFHIKGTLGHFVRKNKPHSTVGNVSSWTCSYVDNARFDLERPGQVSPSKGEGVELTLVSEVAS